MSGLRPSLPIFIFAICVAAIVVVVATLMAQPEVGDFLIVNGAPAQPFQTDMGQQ